MRISDWSSDVCSSDLQAEDVAKQLLVVGILLELHQLDVQLRKAFVGLGQKFTQQIIHRLSPTFAWQPGFKSGAIAAVDPSPKKSQNTRKERLRTPYLIAGNPLCFAPSEAFAVNPRSGDTGRSRGGGRSETRRVGKGGVSACRS